ncbi:hypothetical protein Tco_0252972 [Tanacetum coccineum]
MATLNESFPQETDSGSGPRCQDTILGGAEAQTRFEAASKQSNDPPLSRVNTLRSGEDSMKLKELMEFCTKLSERALDLCNNQTHFAAAARSFTMKMEILLEPTSNKLMVAGNPVKEILLKLNLPDHRKLKDGGKAKKSVRLMMEKLFGMELKLILFWSTVLAKTINGEEQLHALVDGKKIIITESSVRRDLQLADEEGVDCLLNSTIFEQLTLMGLTISPNVEVSFFKLLCTTDDIEDMTFDVYALPCYGLVLFVMALFIHAL